MRRFNRWGVFALATAVAWSAMAQGTEGVPAPVDDMPPATVQPDADPVPVGVSPETPGPSVLLTDTPAPLPLDTDHVLLKSGLASWYGPGFHGRRTANGERYNMHELTTAHRYLPFGTLLTVRSVHTGQSVVVRINDRGPYKHQRILDLSRAAMDALGVLGRGVTQVEVWVQAHQLNSFQAATERFRQRQAVSPKKQASGKLKNPAVHQRR